MEPQRSNLDAVFGDTIPEMRPLPDLGVPNGLLLGGLYRAEHTLFWGAAKVNVDGDQLVLHGVGTGVGEQCPNWPSDRDLADARARIGKAS
jgi:hypothetical protein